MQVPNYLKGERMPTLNAARHHKITQKQMYYNYMMILNDTLAIKYYTVL